MEMMKTMMMKKKMKMMKTIMTDSSNDNYRVNE